MLPSLHDRYLGAARNNFLIRLYTDLARGIELRACETHLSLISTLLRDQCSPPILLTIDLVRPPCPHNSSCSCPGCRRWRIDRLVLSGKNLRRRCGLLWCSIYHNTMASFANNACCGGVVTGRKAVTITDSVLSITVISSSLTVSIVLPLRACLASLSLAFRSASAASGPVIKRDPPWVRLRLPDGFGEASGAPIGRDYKARCCCLISTNFSCSRSTCALKRARSSSFRLARMIVILSSVDVIISGLACGGCCMSLSCQNGFHS